MTPLGRATALGTCIYTIYLCMYLICKLTIRGFVLEVHTKEYWAIICLTIFKVCTWKITVEPLIVDTPNSGHLCLTDIWPLHWPILLYTNKQNPWIADTLDSGQEDLHQLILAYCNKSPIMDKGAWRRTLGLTAQQYHCDCPYKLNLIANGFEQTL